MTDRPDLSKVEQQAPAQASKADINGLAHDLRLRRRKERSEVDTAKNDKWLAKEAAALGVTADYIEDVMVGAIVHDVHNLPDF